MNSRLNKIQQGFSDSSLQDLSMNIDALKLFVEVFEKTNNSCRNVTSLESMDKSVKEADTQKFLAKLAFRNINKHYTQHKLKCSGKPATKSIQK